MITKEDIAQIKGLKRVKEFPGWLFNKYSMLLVGSEVAEQYEEDEDLSSKTQLIQGFVDNLLKKEAGVDVVEMPGLRIYYVAGDFVPCKACGGEGEVEVGGCDCPHCTGTHECEKCHGSCGTGTREDLGQIVFTGELPIDRRVPMIQGCFAKLIAGKTLRYDEDSHRFYVYDENGLGVGVIMLFAGCSRKP